MRGLWRLRADPDLAAARSYIDDMILYAEIGRDRRNLGPEYVERVEHTAREQVELFRAFAP